MVAQITHAQLETPISQIIANAREALNPTPLRVVRLAPGVDVAWDECCDGYLWARIAGVDPIIDPNQPVHACRIHGYIARIELGVLRCAAVVSEDGTAPSAREIESDGLEGLRDMETLANVLSCFGVRSLIGWNPVGPEGGCHGGAWTFTLRFENCADC